MKKYSIILLFFLSIKLIAQSNLEVYKDLIDKSIFKFDSLFSEQNRDLKLFILLSSDKEQLREYITKSFLRAGFNLLEDTRNIIIYYLSDLSVNYNVLSNNSLFKESIIERKILLKGSILSSLNNFINPIEFLYEFKDIVNYEDIDNLEDKTLSFTQGEKPDFPKLKNLVQPFLIVGVLVSTVILFFTVRSK